MGGGGGGGNGVGVGVKKRPENLYSDCWCVGTAIL